MNQFMTNSVPEKVVRYLEAYLTEIIPTESDPPSQIRRLISQLESDVEFAAAQYDGKFEHVPTIALARELIHLADAREAETADSLLIRSVHELRAIAEGLYSIATKPRQPRTTLF